MHKGKYKKKLRNALILSFSIPTLILILSSGLFFYFVAKRSMDEELGKRLTTIASLTAIQARDWGFSTLSPGDENSNTYKAILLKLKRLKTNSGLKKIYIFDKKNRSFADTDQSIPIGHTYYGHTIHNKEIGLSMSGTPTQSLLFKGKDNNFYKSGFAPVLDNKGEVSAIIGVEASADFFIALESLRGNIFIFILIGFFIAVVVSLFLSTKIVTPIKELVSASRDIGEGKMQTDIKIRSKNEIGFLAQAITEMKSNILERDRRLRAMMQGIAHEVRNPLGGIELFAGLLKEEIKLTSDSKHYVEKIENEVKNLKILVDEFLDFAKGVKPLKTEVELESFSQDLSLYFTKELSGRNISLEIDIPKKIEKFYFDPEQMKRALLNIIRNSIDELENDGKITLGFKRENGYQTIYVRDSGKGIAPEVIPLIFDPFFSTKESGSGLGLSFARKIVNSHGGEMEVDSAKGRGTKIKINLPFSD